MPVDWGDTLDRIFEMGKNGDTETPIQIVSDVIKDLPEALWTQVLRYEFTTTPQELAAEIDKWVRQVSKEVELKAAYAELAGYDDNEWYFNLFGYARAISSDDFDLLAEYDTEASEDIQLSGFEEYGETVMEPYPQNKDERSVKDHADLLIVCKFQDLIRRAVEQTKLLNVPMLATVHEYDYIAEIRK